MRVSTSKGQEREGWRAERSAAQRNDLVPRERPVRLRGARVVIVQEGHGARRPETHDARRLALVVLEAPVLRVAHRVLQDALRGEVERLRQATGAVHPVHRALAMRPLVVLKCAMRVAQRVPRCGCVPDGEERVGCFDVAAHKFTAVALGEVEAPAVVAHLMTQVVEPLAQILLHLLVGVIDVGRRREVVAGGAVAGSAKVWVISGDGPLSPRHALAVVAVPGAPAALLRRRPVVDDNVCNCHCAGLSPSRSWSPGSTSRWADSPAAPGTVRRVASTHPRSPPARSRAPWSSGC
eukprot:scaffold2755_cov333-Prasinococcus_capsulatus_cf.AAC.5